MYEAQKCTKIAFNLFPLQADYIELDFARSEDPASNPGAITRAARGKGYVSHSAKPSDCVFFEFKGIRQREHFLWIHGCESGSGG